MHLVIITKTLPPGICGIADHSVLLAKAIQEKGHDVSLIAGEGEQVPGVTIVKKFWCEPGLRSLEQILANLKPDHVLLQYTPLSFSVDRWHQNPELVDFWARCGNRWSTSLVLHESYFQAWWHPPSLLNGPLEKAQMKRLVASTSCVFTASEPLLQEIDLWPGQCRTFLLPIGSNLPCPSVGRENQRAYVDVSSNEIVLTLFGGGVNLRKRKCYVEAVDTIMQKNRVSTRWLLLGGVRPECFSLRSPVLSPGFLPPDELSAYLQITDVFLMPHISGLSAKRGTLMAALQLRLPVVGTDGPMTDRFWRGVPGVVLTSMPGKRQFAEAVYDLATSGGRRGQLSQQNSRLFEEHFTWPGIAGKLLEALS